MYIQVDFQKAYDYFNEHLTPYQPPDDDDTGGWFDRWLDWLIGDKCIEGNDTMYLYKWWATGESRLRDFDIDFHIVDEHGNILHD